VTVYRLGRVDMVYKEAVLRAEKEYSTPRIKSDDDD
jgi:hypothetical protein